NQPFFFARIFGNDNFGSQESATASGDTNPTDIMMVLDLSGSMRSSGRIEALWHSAPTFVDVIEQFGSASDEEEEKDQIGVMGLSGDPDGYDPVAEGHSGTLYSSGLHATANHRVGVLEARLTTNYDYLRDTVLSQANLEARKYGGGTGTGAAIGDAAHYLEYSAETRDDVAKVIVLMSDGHANKPSGNGPGYARAMARYAAGLDVTIYTISLGNDADLNLMQDIAEITGGNHFDATGSGWGTLTHQLTEAFKQAAADIKRVHLVK
ncbi:MAG: vWA domain-containing protein, partial [Planctomycetota bacterium]